MHTLANCNNNIIGSLISLLATHGMYSRDIATQARASDELPLKLVINWLYPFPVSLEVSKAVASPTDNHTCHSHLRRQECT